MHDNTARDPTKLIKEKDFSDVWLGLVTSLTRLYCFPISDNKVQNIHNVYNQTRIATQGRRAKKTRRSYNTKTRDVR